MGEETQAGKAAVIMDINGLIQAVRDEVTDQVRFVVSLDPNAPSVAFTIPDCGSEEMTSKVRTLVAGADKLVDTIFRWTAGDNYDGGEDDEHDPSIA